MTNTINLTEARANFQDVLNRVEHGECLLVAQTSLNLTSHLAPGLESGLLDKNFAIKR